MFEHFRGDCAYAEPVFCCQVSDIVFLLFTVVLLDGIFDDFSTFRLFIVENCILFWLFWVRFENYSMRWLSIRGNDFITGCTGKCLKSNISAESNMNLKNLVLQALEIIRIRFRQKSI
jgi:hypothetical protein